MAIRKAKITKAQNALIKAGMDPALTKSAWRLLDLDGDLSAQIEALAEEDPELFEPAEDDSDDQDTDDTPMTAAEAKRARLSGGHRLRPARPEGTPAQQNAQALGAGRTRTPRPTTAPATAQAAAARLRAGVGRSADL